MKAMYMYWSRLSVVCIVALASSWQAHRVLAGPFDSIVGGSKIGVGGGVFKEVKPSSGMQQVVVSPDFGKAVIGPGTGSKMVFMDPKFALSKFKSSAQIDPKFNPNAGGILKNNPKINPDLAGKLTLGKKPPKPDGPGNENHPKKPAPGKWWGHPWGKGMFGPGYYGSHFAGYYDYGPAYASPSYGLPPANVLPAAPMRVAIENPLGNGVRIQFVIDGQAGSLEPGQRIEIGQLNPQVVEFDRGGQFGVARYGLAEGIYTFAATPQGIELYHGEYTLSQ